MIIMIFLPSNITQTETKRPKWITDKQEKQVYEDISLAVYAAGFSKGDV